MSRLFQELDHRATPFGDLVLRRRHSLQLATDIYEIKLGDDFLMSSFFTASEIALARLALAEVMGPNLQVVVGGLGLGYTAHAVLEYETVASLIVVDALEAVIDWHRTGLVPLGAQLTSDPRCRLVQGDFFAMSASAAGFDPATPGRKIDAVIVDIDHAPDALLDPANASFYEGPGLSCVARHIVPGGVFALWSNDAPDHAFVDRLARTFATARAEAITFHNPLQDRIVTQTVYIARTAREVEPAAAS